MEKTEVENLKKLLINKISKHPDKKYQKEEKNSPIRKNYLISSRTGRKVYESFTDEELLAYLRKLATELGHAPAQGEVFWVLRDYIKHRFSKWPYALRAAGLSSSAGKGGKSMEQSIREESRKEELLEMVKKKALELGKLPHPKDLPEVLSELKKYYSQWNQVIEAAGIEAQQLNEEVVYKIEDLEPVYREMLKAIARCAEALGRSPAHHEVDSDVKKALIKRCGSFRNALYQIDLEPVIKTKPFSGIYIDYRKKENRTGHTANLQDCCYKVLHLAPEDEALLMDIEKNYKRKGSIPLKREVPKEIRAKLLAACGSWVNVLYQIGVTPKEYYAAVKEARRHEK